MVTHLKKYFHATYELVSKKEGMVKSYFKNFSLKVYNVIFLGQLEMWRRGELFWLQNIHVDEEASVTPDLNIKQEL